MTEKQVSRYIRLVDRRLYILLHSGIDWRPEYGPEMEQIDQELAKLRPLIDQEHKRKEMQSMGRQYITAPEVAEALGVSVGKAYSVIRELNGQLKAQGYLTISGKVSRAYFEEKCCYGGMKAAGE